MAQVVQVVHRFKRSVIAVFIAFVIICIVFALLLTLICRDARKHFNGIDPATDANLIDAFGTRLYFAVVSSKNTGYGDITPKSTTCRGLTMFVLLTMSASVLSCFLLL